MIGGFEVRRLDGGLVASDRWRTAKTRDLLRLLVLERGRLVRTDRILDALWPDVDRPHGAASIRTAASRIRLVVGSPCVQRRPGGLAACGIRSDVDELEDLLRRVRARRAVGDHAGVLVVADLASRLLDGELWTDALDERRGGDDSWAVQAHAQVAAVQSEIRTLQAEAALALADLHRAVDLARRAILSDPSCQEAQRVLMHSLTALGEVDRALRVRDRLRVAPRGDAGVQPQARTRKVREHAQWALAELTPVGPRSVGVPAQRGSEQAWSAPSTGQTGSLEVHLLRWLRERARGGSIRVRVVYDDSACEEFPVELTVSARGTLEVVDEARDALRSWDA